MKKTYIQPNIEVIKIQTFGVLANSMTSSFNSSTNDFDDFDIEGAETEESDVVF